MRSYARARVCGCMCVRARARARARARVCVCVCVCACVCVRAPPVCLKQYTSPSAQGNPCKAITEVHFLISEKCFVASVSFAIMHMLVAESNQPQLFVLQFVPRSPSERRSCSFLPEKHAETGF